MIIVQLIIGIVSALGIGFILADIFNLPSLKATKAARNVGKTGNKKTSALEIYLGGFAEELSHKIKLNEWKRNDLERELTAAGMKETTPELFICNALVRAVAIGIFAIPAFFIFKLLSFIIIAFAVFVYFKETKGITGIIKKKQSRIEAEMPRFVLTVNNQLKNGNRDVIDILESYKSTAGEDLAAELEITTVQMRSGNDKEAIKQLQSRLNMDSMNQVADRIISVLDGHYNDAAWELLASDFTKKQKENLNMQANKVPRKMRKCSMALLFCFILIYVAVLGQILMSSLGNLF